MGLLPLARHIDAGTNDRRGLAIGRSGQFGVGDGWNFDMDVDAVE